MAGAHFGGRLERSKLPNSLCGLKGKREPLRPIEFRGRKTLTLRKRRAFRQEIGY